MHKNKLISLLILALLISNILLISLVLAQEDDPIAQAGVPYLTQANIDARQAQLEQLRNQSTSDYLKQEWRSIALKNPVVARIDSTLEKASIVFRVLFGVPYTLSLELAFIIFFWVIFGLLGGRVIDSSGIVKGKIAYLAGFVSVIILAQIPLGTGGLFNLLVKGLEKLVYYPENNWVRFLIVMIILAATAFLNYGVRKASDKLKEERKKKKMGETEQSQKEIKAFAKGMEEGRESVKK